jgi:translocation and assembly module TamB
VLSGSVRLGGTTEAPAVAGEAKLALDGGGAIAVEGRADTAAGGTFDATVTGTGVPVQDVLEAALAGGDPERAAALKLPKIDGTLAVHATARGTVEHFTVDGDGTATLAAGAKLGAHGTVTSDGTLGLSVEGENVPLALALRTALAAASPTSGDWKSIADMTATLALKGTLTGPATAPAFDGAANVGLGDEGRVEAKGRVDVGGALALELKTAGLSLERAVWTAVALLEPKRAPELLAKVPRLGGAVDATGTLGGTLAAPTLTAHASARNLAIDATGLGVAELDGRLTAGRVLTVTGTALGGSAVVFKTTLAGELPFDATVKFPATDLLSYAADARAVMPGMTIYAEGDAHVYGELANYEGISGKGGLTRFEVATKNVTIGAVERLKVALTKGRLDVTPTTFGARDRATADYSTFLVGGSYDLGEEMDLDVEGDVSLGVIAALVPGGVISGASGRIEGFAASIRGTPSSPFMSGRGHVVGHRFALSFMPEELTDFTGDVALSGSQIELTEVTGSVTSGTVKVNGTIDLESVTSPQFDLALDIREVTTRFVEDWPAKVDGVMTVNGTPSALELAGHIEVLEAHYTKDVDWKPNLADVAARRLGGGGTPRPIIVRAPAKTSGAGFLQLNIELRCDGGIFIKNNIADLEGYIDSTVKPLRVLGTDRNPYIDGIARVKPGGMLRLFDKEFEVTRGDVSFEDKYRIDPRFDIEANTVIDPYTITVLGHGTIDTLAFDLKSEPARAVDDIVLLITLGVSREDFDAGISSGTSVLGAGLAASGVTEKVLKPVEDVVPLDFAVGTRLSEKTGTYVPVIVGAKRITPKLRIRGSTSFADPTGDFEAGAEYKVGKGVSIHSTYDVESSTGFGDVGLDLKWKKKF